MSLLYAFLVVFGLPFLLAATPGIVAVVSRSPRLGGALIAGAAVVVCPLAIYVDRLFVAKGTAKGLIVDDLSFFVRPWEYAIWYALLSASAIWIWRRERHRRSRSAK